MSTFECALRLRGQGPQPFNLTFIQKGKYDLELLSGERDGRHYSAVEVMTMCVDPTIKDPVLAMMDASSRLMRITGIAEVLWRDKMGLPELGMEPDE